MGNKLKKTTDEKPSLSLVLTERETALILLIRKVRNGQIQKISVRDGEPHFLDFRPLPTETMTISQQVDLSNPAQVKELLEQLI